jgi:hypothetical protein
MIAKMEKMIRGETIWPPCDRCRRLKMDCTKYLTACAGCTKKHCKCAWNDITEDEIEYLNEGLPAPGATEDEDANNVAGGAPVAPDMTMNANLDPGLRASDVGIMDGQEHGNGESFAASRNSLKMEVSSAGRGIGRSRDIRDADMYLSEMASTAAAATTQ